LEETNMHRIFRWQQDILIVAESRADALEQLEEYFKNYQFGEFSGLRAFYVNCLKEGSPYAKVDPGEYLYAVDPHEELVFPWDILKDTLLEAAERFYDFKEDGETRLFNSVWLNVNLQAWQFAELADLGIYVF